MHRPGRLPPLNPLRAFEAAARHMSFTKAAIDLGVTQGAVSRQVKALEDQLGLRLFVRDGNELQLAQGARQYARALTDAFRTISQATDSLVQVSSHSILTLQTYQTFMTRWLVPRLPEFYQVYPDIELRVITSNNHAYLSEMQVDCVIRYGDDRWDNMHSTLLFHDQWTPVCSRHFLDQHSHGGLGKLFAPSNLLHHHKHPTIWQQWLHVADLPPVETRYDMIFNHHAVITELARAGVGIALEQRPYIESDLRQGLLLQPHPMVLDCAGGYYLSWPASSAKLEKLQIFKDWLKEKCSEEAARYAQIAPVLQ